jgi:hypothetical protein
MKNSMLKKISVSGGLYLLAAVLFALGTIGKTVSNDSTIIAIQWFCAVVFAGASIWKFRKKVG